jgi:8-oxo-dGTP diphosphatase
MKTINVEGAIIVNDEYILCAQRGIGRILELKWEFPGGKIGHNETPEAAIIREINEELGCEIIIVNGFLTSKYVYDFGEVNLTTYICKITNETPRNIEHNQLRWVHQNQLADLDWAPADIPAVIKLQNERGLHRL